MTVCGTYYIIRLVLHISKLKQRNVTRTEKDKKEGKLREKGRPLRAQQQPGAVLPACALRDAHQTPEAAAYSPTERFISRATYSQVFRVRGGKY